ncbi:MAG: hypothetical protein U0744_17030 [Gemmataceae bacterium]
MSDAMTPKDTELARLHKQLGEAGRSSFDSFDAKGDGVSEKLVDQIEMIGEEQASKITPATEITPGMRYLHSSRTIHQLVTDRNRAVGIFFTVASLLLTASGVILNASPRTDMLVPFTLIQRWCLPVTFAALTVLAILMAFLLIRTRIGLIYEVAKMNALLGLPIGRVQRIGVLSIFFILQSLISLAGGLTAALCAVFYTHYVNPDTTHAGWVGFVVGVIVTVSLVILYVVTVNITTSDKKLQDAK